MLMIGSRIPDLEVEALMPDGRFEKLDTNDLCGRWTVLFFYPLDFTFVFPTEIRAYDNFAPQFEKANALLLGASVDSVHTHRAWVRDGLGEVSFPLIGDVNRKLAQAFDVLLEEEGVAARATFIIDPEGRVASASVNALNVGRSANETLRLIQAFQAGGLTSCEWQPGEPLLRPE